jgi:hypothetical protein
MSDRSDGFFVSALTSVTLCDASFILLFFAFPSSRQEFANFILFIFAARPGRNFIFWHGSSLLKTVTKKPMKITFAFEEPPFRGEGYQLSRPGYLIGACPDLDSPFLDLLPDGWLLNGALPAFGPPDAEWGALPDLEGRETAEAYLAPADPWMTPSPSLADISAAEDFPDPTAVEPAQMPSNGAILPSIWFASLSDETREELSRGFDDLPEDAREETGRPEEPLPFHLRGANAVLSASEHLGEALREINRAVNLLKKLPEEIESGLEVCSDLLDDGDEIELVCSGLLAVVRGLLKERTASPTDDSSTDAKIFPQANNGWLGVSLPAQGCLPNKTKTEDGGND